EHLALARRRYDFREVPTLFYSFLISASAIALQYKVPKVNTMKWMLPAEEVNTEIGFLSFNFLEQPLSAAYLDPFLPDSGKLPRRELSPDIADNSSIPTAAGSLASTDTRRRTSGVVADKRTEGSNERVATKAGASSSVVVAPSERTKTPSMPETADNSHGTSSTSVPSQETINYRHPTPSRRKRPPPKDADVIDVSSSEEPEQAPSKKPRTNSPTSEPCPTRSNRRRNPRTISSNNLPGTSNVGSTKAPRIPLSVKLDLVAPDVERTKLALEGRDGVTCSFEKVVQSHICADACSAESFGMSLTWLNLDDY
ncbi:hypothetical protein V5O48_019142, partial [Marasmius crinis-equi]